MAKILATIGYAEQVETSPGVWRDQITERDYAADMTRNSRRLEASEYLNDDINITNIISIVADKFAYQNFHAIKYVEFMGARWKVSTVEVQHPRLMLTLGGLYNG